MSEPAGPIARVPGTRREHATWYDRISRWYGLVADPFEAEPRRLGVELLSVQPGERVLEVGFGSGTALVDLAAYAGGEGRVVGVDAARGMCDVARDTIDDAHVTDRVTLVQGDAFGLPFRDGTFDAAFASFVLELFDTPDLPLALAEWRRVLTPDGRLCIVSLGKGNEGVAVRAYERLHELFPRALDCRPLYGRALLEANGFVVEESIERSMWGLAVDVLLARPA